MTLPTLRQLRYLTAVVALKHFGKAAEQCFVTQSTLSAGIQDLEALLGATLLERTTRKVLVTALGQEVAQRAQQILSLAADLVDVAELEKNPITGRITIGEKNTIITFLFNK
jgi:LysR family hydrogen peroxide-inducible transcriptional activator